MRCASTGFLSDEYRPIGENRFRGFRQGADKTRHREVKMNGLLTDPYGTVQVLDRYGIRAKKKFGQNFLIDGSVVDAAIEASGITKDDCVLEIGPGIGTMTQHLSMAAGKVVAVEIDTSLARVLEDTLDGYTNVTVLFQDILKTDLRAVASDYNGGRPLKCVANLPYYITTPILLELLQEKGCFESITVMVQKEVAERICAQAGEHSYGALSLAVQYYCSPEVIRSVPPHCFIPRPAVDSTVLCLRAYKEPPVQADEKFMFALIRASFNQRRKTLANAVSHGFSFGGRTISREEVEKALQKLSLSPDVRGEKLSLSAFAALSALLKE